MWVSSQQSRNQRMLLTVENCHQFVVSSSFFLVVSIRENYHLWNIFSENCAKADAFPAKWCRRTTASLPSSRTSITMTTNGKFVWKIVEIAFSCQVKDVIEKHIKFWLSYIFVRFQGTCEERFSVSGRGSHRQRVSRFGADARGSALIRSLVEQTLIPLKTIHTTV